MVWSFRNLPGSSPALSVKRLAIDWFTNSSWISHDGARVSAEEPLLEQDALCAPATSGVVTSALLPNAINDPELESSIPRNRGGSLPSRAGPPCQDGPGAGGRRVCKGRRRPGQCANFHEPRDRSRVWVSLHNGKPTAQALGAELLFGPKDLLL